MGKRTETDIITEAVAAFIHEARYGKSSFESLRSGVVGRLPSASPSTNALKMNFYRVHSVHKAEAEALKKEMLKYNKSSDGTEHAKRYKRLSDMRDAHLQQSAKALNAYLELAGKDPSKS